MGFWNGVGTRGLLNAALGVPTGLTQSRVKIKITTASDL
jgi:hypothetical protein